MSGAAIALWTRALRGVAEWALARLLDRLDAAGQEAELANRAEVARQIAARRRALRARRRQP